MKPSETDRNDDHELMRRVSAGDVPAYNQLVATYLDPLFSFCCRLLRQPEEAEEITQEVFLRVWQRAGEYQPKAKLSTWLYTIAHNLAVDRLRKRREHAAPALVDSAPASGWPSTLLERKQTAEAVQRALDDLPERQRSAIVLVHHQGLSNPEAAKVLGVGVEAVESLLARGRRKLRESLKHEVAARKAHQS